jgi:hypothetical protein
MTQICGKYRQDRTGGHWDGVPDYDALEDSLDFLDAGDFERENLNGRRHFRPAPVLTEQF